MQLSCSLNMLFCSEGDEQEEEEEKKGYRSQYTCCPLCISKKSPYVSQYHEHTQKIALQKWSSVIFFVKSQSRSLNQLFYILLILILNLNFFILKLGLAKYDTWSLSQHSSAEVVKPVGFPNLSTCLANKGDSRWWSYFSLILYELCAYFNMIKSNITDS